jgi:hypothetical protein
VVTPITLTRVSQRIPPIDYTSRDFEAIAQDMVRCIPFFAPEWTDHNLSDFGIVLQRLLAFVADSLHFYVDRIGNEAFLPTTITRRSVINLLQLINFRLNSAAPASVDVVFSIENPLGGDLVIPKGTLLQTTADATDKPIYFETSADAVIPGGQLEVTTAAVEGQSKSEIVGVSLGIARQRFALTGVPIIDGTLVLWIDEGIGEQLWQEIESFAYSGPDDKNFTTTRDDNDIVTVYFGDNSQGKIPDQGANIRADYRVGGGSNGNVPENTITTVLATFSFNGNPVVVAVTNPNAASGGEDAMTIDEAKVAGPRSLLALNRAVTAEDFVALAEAFPGIAKAFVVVGATPMDPSSGCCCLVRLTIAPTGGGIPSSQLKADLLAYLEDRKMIGTCVEIVDPEYQPIDGAGTIYMASNFSTEQGALDIDNAITAFFDLGSEFVGFGQGLYLSDFYRLLDSIPGVDHADLTELTRRPMPNCGPWCGDAAIGTVAVGIKAVNETWTIIFTSPTTFTARGSVSGLQANTGTLGVAYTSDDGEVSFTVVPGTVAPCVGDTCSFITSPKVANIPINSNEIMEKGNFVFNFIGGAKPQRVCPA